MYINVCVATDENYISLVKVLLVSIFTNTNEKIIVHIFEFAVSANFNDELNYLAKLFNQNVQFYDAENIVNSIKAKISNDWADRNSYSAYVRLFMADILDKSIDKFLYLDCDTIVLQDIASLFQKDLMDFYIGGVKDVLPTIYKKSINLKLYPYVNSGVLLINAQKWRNDKIGDKCLRFCLDNADSLFPDQDAINKVMKDKVMVLEPKYCVFYPEYIFPYKMQRMGFGMDDNYYDKNQMAEARDNPIIIHYADTIFGRPWQKNNINAFACKWVEYFDRLPADFKFPLVKKKLTTKQKIFRMLYKNLPISISARIYYARRNRGIFERIEEKNKK